MGVAISWDAPSRACSSGHTVHGASRAHGHIPLALGFRGPCLASMGRGFPAGTVRSPGCEDTWEELTEVSVHWHQDSLGVGRSHDGAREHEVVHHEAHSNQSLPWRREDPAGATGREHLPGPG